ncbi:hypothetical protein K0M31_005476 [Melipona bicolor]|uniref:Uncharacterized protein n=1 Tax=Melipona bicolor TaxID=60889 RepID=A0AA40KMK5_9HYME|nr:hypothetical protein K0M31_005476 [Melipona bicolor]
MCVTQGVSGATDQDRRRTNFWECKVHGRTAICFGLFLRSPGINVSRFNTVDRGRWIDRVTERILGRVMMPRDARLRQPGETHTESKSVLLWDSPVIPNKKKKNNNKNGSLPTHLPTPLPLYRRKLREQQRQEQGGRAICSRRSSRIACRCPAPSSALLGENKTGRGWENSNGEEERRKKRRGGLNVTEKKKN